MGSNVCRAIEFISAGPRDFQIKQFRIESHENAMLLTESGNLRRTLIEGTHRKIIRNLIYHVLAQESWQVFKTAAKRVSCFRRATAVPCHIYEPEYAVAQLRSPVQPLCKIDSSFIGPENQNVAQIAP